MQCAQYDGISSYLNLLGQLLLPGSLCTHMYALWRHVAVGSCCCLAHSVHTSMPSGATLQWAAAVARLYSVHTCMPSGAPSSMHRDDRNAVYGTALPYEATWLTDQHNRPPVAIGINSNTHCMSTKQ